jgi:hypothetical protein
MMRFGDQPTGWRLDARQKADAVVSAGFTLLDGFGTPLGTSASLSLHFAGHIPAQSR